MEKSIKIIEKSKKLKQEIICWVQFTLRDKSPQD